MRKSLIAVIIILTLLVGAVLGAGGVYYMKIVLPEKQIEQIGREQKEKMDKMVRRGEVMEINPDSFKLKVEAGGGDIGKTVKLRTNEYTTIQVGMEHIGKGGVKTDITKWFKEGDYVNVIAKDGQALALHREARPGEVEEVEADESFVSVKTDKGVKKYAKNI